MAISDSSTSVGKKTQLILDCAKIVNDFVNAELLRYHPMNLPLSGLRVLDLSRALSGPFGTMVLGDLGADVTKVEPAPGGELIRLWGPKQDGVTLYYMVANRNKRSLMLDFRDPEALALLQRMAMRADIVVENFRPGVTRDMGLDYPTLHALNPRLIYGSISGFGPDGPKRDYPGFDIIAQAMSGVMSVNGERNGGPLRVGIPVGDMGAGMWLVVGILAALRQRDQTGLGQHIETSLLATLMNMLSYHGQGYLSLGIDPQRTGNTHPVIQPYGAYRTRDGSIVIAPGTQDMWSALCKTLGVPELSTDPRFAEPLDRLKHADVLQQVLEQRLADDTADNWSARMVEAGIAAAPIHTVAQALEDPQVAAAGLVESVQHPILGPIRLVANPFRMSGAGAAPTVRMAPPQPGEHNRACLRDYGIDDAEINQLLERGTIRNHPSAPLADAAPQ